ncbi:MAG: nuclear transport factor 2 family protein [Candidatus Nanopelagicales bacterium]
MSNQKLVQEIVDEYLQLCEDRELDKASHFLASDAVIIFPGGRRYASLQEMAAASNGRYSWVRKLRNEYAVGQGVSADGKQEQIVTSIGTLYGEKLDGAPFDGIRYVDVFMLREGLIVRQEVWNDLAESGIIQLSEGK